MVGWDGELGVLETPSLSAIETVVGKRRKMHVSFEISMPAHIYYIASPQRNAQTMGAPPPLGSDFMEC